jgi:hypothetical protein
MGESYAVILSGAKDLAAAPQSRILRLRFRMTAAAM